VLLSKQLQQLLPLGLLLLLPQSWAQELPTLTPQLLLALLL
jgi:hypothetical protein